MLTVFLDAKGLRPDIFQEGQIKSDTFSDRNRKISEYHTACFLYAAFFFGDEKKG